ncbi:stress-induced protein [Lactococcus lactis]|uniref:Ubiquinone biosynthesis protein COQ9 n=1 Tax=Lactococcus lactis TaxID=1358 RepID=A0AAW5TN79_9LACT|nr:stress-induced protein [Lactococcus lactis]MCW2281409.1 ubiquinone biosynthesis protein COQ9 [Lactococcus lactis]MCW2281451.1 ubiquinone biosynthesis protein COQ9 [Lactococcus lactis]
MANEENLKPQNKRTKSEQREIAKKGGIASGKSRRKKADLRKTLNMILTSEVTEDEISQKLKKLGFENTYEVALALTLVKEALSGDISAISQIIKLTGANKDRYDLAEQKERTQLLRNQNKQATDDDKTSDESVVIIDDIPVEDIEDGD